MIARVFAHDEALSLRVLPTALPQTTWANKDIDALISDLGKVINALEQEDFDLRVLFLKHR